MIKGIECICLTGRGSSEIGMKWVYFLQDYAAKCVNKINTSTVKN